MNAQAEEARRRADEDFQQGQVLHGQSERQTILNTALSQASPQAREQAATGIDPSAMARNYAEAGEMGQRGGYYGALGHQANVMTSPMAAETSARAVASPARAGLYGSQGSMYDPSIDMRHLFGGYPFASGTADVPRFSMNAAMEHEYKHGKTRVPGHGDSAKDSVPSMLAPGEAVLNTEAADHLGRGTIDLLNAIGLAKRQVAGVGAAQGQDGGMASGGPAAQAPDQNVPTYAEGTDYTQRMNQMPGSPTGGTWGPHGDTPRPVGTTGGDLRASLGLGVPRPAPQPTPQGPKPLGYAKGVKRVPAQGDEAARGQNGPTPKNLAQAAVQGYKEGIAEVQQDPGARPTVREGLAVGDRGYGQADRRAQGADAQPGKPTARSGLAVGDRGYAKGTSQVPPQPPHEKAKEGKAPPPQKTGGKEPPGRKSNDRSSHDRVAPDGHVTIHPNVLQALLAMRSGGMPTPGTTQPLPMPMPMAGGAGQTPMQMGGNQTRLPMQGGGQ
jgi:hypothetical protein